MDAVKLEQIRADFLQDLTGAGDAHPEIDKVVTMLRFVAVLHAAGETVPGAELGILDVDADLTKARALSTPSGSSPCACATWKTDIAPARR